MPRFFRSQIEVRGYELDSFGHVNHAAYVSYLEHARWHVLRDAGVTLQILNEWKRWPVIARIEVDYLRPTYMGDLLDIETQVVEHKKTSFVFSQRILRGTEPVLQAKVQAVMVNEKGRPSPLPPELNRLWTEGTTDSGEGAAP
jgi:acyl-CoA thioester hydrolase